MLTIIIMFGVLPNMAYEIVYFLFWFGAIGQRRYRKYIESPCFVTKKGINLSIKKYGYPCPSDSKLLPEEFRKTSCDNNKECINVTE